VSISGYTPAPLAEITQACVKKTSRSVSEEGGLTNLGTSDLRTLGYKLPSPPAVGAVCAPAMQALRAAVDLAGTCRDSRLRVGRYQAWAGPENHIRDHRRSVHEPLAMGHRAVYLPNDSATIRAIA